MTYGPTDAGFVKPNLATIKAEIEAVFRDIYGDDFDLAAETLPGHIIATMSDRELAIWEGMEALYNQMNPDTASGKGQDNLFGINAITRTPATKSVVVLVFEGTPATVIPTGSTFSVSGSTTAIFETVENVTLGAGADEVQSIAFSSTPTSGSWKITIGALETAALAHNVSAATVQTEIHALVGDGSLDGITVAGSMAAGFTVTYAGINGKRPQDLLEINTNTLLDGVTSVTATVTTSVDGEYQAEATARATTAGAISANAETITVIDNAIAGLDSVYNPSAAVIGSAIETDEEFRKRRKTRIVTSINATLGAMRNAVLAINDAEPTTEILSCHVAENDTLGVVNGLAAKSALVVPYYAGAPITGMDNLIAEAIYRSKPAGIELNGSVSVDVTGDDGQIYTVLFDRPTPVPIYIDLGIGIIGGISADQEAALKEYIATLGNQLGVGENVYVYGRDSISDWLNEWTGANIVDFNIKIGVAPAPAADDYIVIDDGTLGGIEIATFSAANITITPTI